MGKMCGISEMGVGEGRFPMGFKEAVSLKERGEPLAVSGKCTVHRTDKRKGPEAEVSKCDIWSGCM